MSRARRIFTRRHRNKWAVLSAVMSGATALLQFIPQSWPAWLAAGLTVMAYAATGAASLLGDDDAR